MGEKQYLGEGVYVQVQNGMLMLTVEDGSGVASDTIFLEVTTMDAFVKYYDRAKKALGDLWSG